MVTRAATQREMRAYLLARFPHVLHVGERHVRVCRWDVLVAKLFGIYSKETDQGLVGQSLGKEKGKEKMLGVSKKIWHLKQTYE